MSSLDLLSHINLRLKSKTIPQHLRKLNIYTKQTAEFATLSNSAHYFQQALHIIQEETLFSSSELC